MGRFTDLIRAAEVAHVNAKEAEARNVDAARKMRQREIEDLRNIQSMLLEDADDFAARHYRLKVTFDPADTGPPRLALRIVGTRQIVDVAAGRNLPPAQSEELVLDFDANRKLTMAIGGRRGVQQAYPTNGTIQAAARVALEILLNSYYEAVRSSEG